MVNFCTSFADPLHDCSNAFLWATKPHVEETTMKNLFIAVLSVRNSYDAIVENLALWLSTVVHFSDHTHQRETLLELYSSMGIDGVFLECLVKWRVLFHEGKLHVDSSASGSSTAFDDIAGVLLGVWKFDSFSESRFLKVESTSKISAYWHRQHHQISSGSQVGF